MVKMTDKRKETVSFYRQLLDPMGYTITPKVTKKVKGTGWKPKSEDIKEYNEMDSLKIEKTMQDLKSTTTISLRLRTLKVIPLAIGLLIGANPGVHLQNIVTYIHTDFQL